MRYNAHADPSITIASRNAERHDVVDTMDHETMADVRSIFEVYSVLGDTRWPLSGSAPRRKLAAAACGAAFVTLRPSIAASQPYNLTMSQLAAKTIADLRAAQRLQDVPAAAEEWNRRFREAARRADQRAATDYEQIVDAIQSELRDEAIKRLITATFPTLAALLERVPAWLGPVFVFLQALTPSNTATDFQMLSETNRRVQDEIYRDTSRFLPPGWDVRIQQQITTQRAGRPTIRLP